MKTRVLVVDDSPFIRRILCDWVKGQDDMECVGVAKDGLEAIQMAVDLRPDVITLDVEMPRCDGLTALKEIMIKAPTRVLMVSSLTTQGADATMTALQTGAVDFVTKPNGANSLHVVGARNEVIAKIRAARVARMTPGSRNPGLRPDRPTMAATDKIVVIASSTGGPKALATLWEHLPRGFTAPILIVQHMPAGFTESFARRLDAIGTVPCKQAKAGDRIAPGIALIAPGGHHMVISRPGHIEINEDPLLHGTRPAADPLFLSAVKHYGRKIVGAVLTGMGRDGAQGAAAIVNAGGVMFGQNEESCTIYGMPKAAMQAGGIVAEYSIEAIADMLVATLEGKKIHAA